MQTHGIVPVIVPIHVVAGALALVFGYVALYAVKGAPLHRTSGILFVYAMLTMSLTGAFMEALITRRISVSVVAGLVTFYFVTTGLLTLRPRVQMSVRIDAAAIVFALTVGLLAFQAGFEMATSGRPEVLRIGALLALAVLLPIAVMLLWLWRIRVRRTFAGMVGFSASRSAPDATVLPSGR